jgi:hypothetical protein
LVRSSQVHSEDVGDRSPVWKRIIWATALVAVNVIAALPYYLMEYRRQVRDVASPARVGVK